MLKNEPTIPLNAEDPGQWSEVITSQRAWFDLRLDELWRYRELVWLFFRRDFISTYKQTVLGPFWFVLPTLFTTFVMALIFGRVAKVSSDGVPHSLFFMLGVTAWTYFAAASVRTHERGARSF